MYSTRITYCFCGTSDDTRTPAYFVNIPMLHLSFPQHFFCFTVTQWWNILPSFVTDCLNKPFHQYVDALRQYCSSQHLAILLIFVLLFSFVCYIVSLLLPIVWRLNYKSNQISWLTFVDTINVNNHIYYQCMIHGFALYIAIW